MKLREFWIREDKEQYVDFFTASSKKFLVENLSDECFEKELIYVREVSPELDAAYAECERALESIKWVTAYAKNYDPEINYSPMDHAEINRVFVEKAREALEAWKKANE